MDPLIARSQAIAVTHETAETSAIAGTIATPGALAKAGTPEIQGPLWTPTAEKISASGNQHQR